MRQLFFSLFIVMTLFVLGNNFPYQHECDTQTTKTDQPQVQNTEHASIYTFENFSQDFVNHYDSLESHIQSDVGESGDYLVTTTLNASCTNDKAQENAAYNLARSEIEESAFKRMMEAYKEEEWYQKNYTETARQLSKNASYRRP